MEAQIAKHLEMPAAPRPTRLAHALPFLGAFRPHKKTALALVLSSLSLIAYKKCRLRATQETQAASTFPRTNSPKWTLQVGKLPIPQSTLRMPRLLACKVQAHDHGEVSRLQPILPQLRFWLNKLNEVALENCKGPPLQMKHLTCSPLLFGTPPGPAILQVSF